MFIPSSTAAPRVQIPSIIPSESSIALPLSSVLVNLNTPSKAIEKDLTNKKVTKETSELPLLFPKVLSECEEFIISTQKEFSNDEVLSAPQLFLATLQDFLKNFSSHYLQGQYEERKALLELFFYVHHVYQKHSSENQTVEHFAACQEINKKAYVTLISLLHTKDAEKLVPSKGHLEAYMHLLTTIQSEILQVADKHFSFHRPYFSDSFAIGSHVDFKKRSSICPMTLIELQHIFHTNTRNLLSYLYGKIFFKNKNLPQDVQLLINFLDSPVTTHIKPLTDNVEISLHFPIKEFAACLTFYPQKLVVRFLGFNYRERWEKISKSLELFPFVELNAWKYDPFLFQEEEHKSHAVGFTVHHEGNLSPFLTFLKTMLFELPVNRDSKSTKVLLKLKDYFLNAEDKPLEFFYKFPELAPLFLSQVCPTKRLEILSLSAREYSKPINKEYAHNYSLLPELQKLVSKLNPTPHTYISIECVKGLLNDIQRGETNIFSEEMSIPHFETFEKALEIAKKSALE